jgi:methionyl-tRNA formyltransferase
MLNRDDFAIDWSSSALTIHRKVMGLHPGATTSWRGKRLKLLATEPLVQRLAEQLSPEGQRLVEQAGLTTTEAAPGRVLAIADGIGLVVATQGCPVLVREAQLEGKTASAGPVLIQQLGARVGDYLGPEPQT